MMVYLTKELGTFGNALYLPKLARNQRIICPEIDSNGDEEGDLTYGHVCFFPEDYESFEREFERRIEHPYDEGDSHLLDANWTRGVRGRFIVVKQKEKISLSQQNVLEEIIKRYRCPVGFYSFSEQNLKENMTKVKAELEKRIETLDFLKKYDNFFQRMYSEAKWVGISEKIKDTKLITEVIG